MNQEDQTDSNAGQQALLLSATRWSLIGVLFERPVGDWNARLKALSSLASDPDLRNAAESAQEEASEGLYHSVFGPTGRVSLREVSYRNGLEPGSMLSELARYYEAFGYRPDIPEPGDHIAVQAGFVGYLCLKEAYARACNDEGKARITAEAARHFIVDHVSTSAKPLAALLENSGVRYLTLAGKSLLRNTVRFRIPDSDTDADPV